MNRDEIKERLVASGRERLSIDPLLDEAQIGALSVDLRLGYDFLVSILTRRPFITLNRADDDYRSIGSYFQTTRRDIGDRFILYPNQVVLTTTLEYIGMPADAYADITMRSSYNRLGISLNTVVDPSYRGCVSIELFNHGNNPIELIVGAKMFQMRLTKIEKPFEYGGLDRKYLACVRPTPSRAPDDRDLRILGLIGEHRQP